jgi:outer membrane protein TolC
LRSLQDSASGADNDEWTVALKAEFPLFHGGSKIYEVRRSRSRLARLQAKRRMVADAVEQRLRSALQDLQATYAGVDLSGVSAKYAEKNLELVQDEYARGEVGVLELLDAQNRRAVLRRKASVAVLDYVEDALRFKRALSDLDGEQEASGETTREEAVP